MPVFYRFIVELLLMCDAFQPIEGANRSAIQLKGVQVLSLGSIVPCFNVKARAKRLVAFGIVWVFRNNLPIEGFGGFGIAILKGLARADVKIGLDRIVRDAGVINDSLKILQPLFSRPGGTVATASGLERE